MVHDRWPIEARNPPVIGLGHPPSIIGHRPVAQMTPVATPLIEETVGMTTSTQAGTDVARFRLNAWEWLAVAVGVAALAVAVRGRANSTPCVFLTLAMPALMVIGSRTERERAGRAVRRLWSSLDAYPAGGKTPWAAALIFVAIPTALLCLSNNREFVAGDTSAFVPTAVSLLTEGDTDLDEFYHPGSWWYQAPEWARVDGVSCFLRRRGDHLYGAHAVGTFPLALPVVAASKLAGGRLSDPLVQLRQEKLTAAAVAGASLGLFFLLALHLVRPPAALATTAILAAASGMLTTVGQNLWQHDGIVLGSLAVLLIEFRRPGRAGAVAQGVLCGLLPACRLTAVSFLVPFGVWVLLRSPRRAAVIALASALAYLPWGAYYLSVYGTPLGPSTVHMAGSLWSAWSAPHLASVLVSPGRGLLTYQPWLVLALLMMLPAMRRGAGEGPTGWALVCVSAIALDVVIASAWHCWWGGWCYGSRLVVGVVPLGALLCARPIAALGASAPGRAAVVGLALLGALVQLPGAYSDPLRWNARHAQTPEAAAWSWSDAPFFAPFSLPTGPRRAPRPPVGPGPRVATGEKAGARRGPF
jgi:hypothetical protein